MTEFPFDDARRLAASALKRYREHRDFDDLISETVLKAWQDKQRHPEMPLSQVVTAQAGFMVKKWFGTGLCGDIVGRKGKGRVPVFTMRWGDKAQVEPEVYDDQVVPDFADQVIEAIVSPADPNEGEIRLTAHEQRRHQEAARRAEVERIYAIAMEKDRALGHLLLTDEYLMAHHREAIRLHYIEGWPMTTVSETIGTGIDSLRHSIRGARRRLERRDQV